MTRAWAIGVGLAATAVVLLATACSDEEIVLATLPPSTEGGPPSELRRCIDDSGCSGAAFCSRRSCNDISGECESRPVICDEQGMPVCGCDGITYWNDCLRRAAGITAMTHGECLGNAQFCKGPGGPGGPDGCPPGAYCARLLPPSSDSTPCPPDVAGTCWAIPAVCPPGGAGPDRWTPCTSPKAVCTTTCDAIRTGEPHRRAKACP